MARSMDILQLASQPESARTPEWERAFLEAIIEAKLTVENPEPQSGPDGWPYLWVKTDPQATEPATRIFSWLSERGIGLVVNPQKYIPDYVFTYGMVWNFRERGQLLNPIAQTVTPGKVELEAGQKVVAGPPSEQYLPDYARKILREFFENQGVKEPKIMVMTADQTTYDLCISLESIGSPDKAEHQGIAEAVSWFLPADYSVVLISESGFNQFISL